MTHAVLCRVGHTGSATGDGGSMARLPRTQAAPARPNPVQEPLTVDVRIRPRSAGLLYARSEGLCNIIQEYTRPGLVVDFYA